MPSLTKDASVAANRVRTTIVIPVEHQILKSACVLDVDAALQPNDGYVVIGLMEGGISHQNKVAVLASGYVGASSMVGWTGSMPITVDTHVFADIYSSAGGDYRLVILPWKIVSTEKGLFVVDP